MLIVLALAFATLAVGPEDPQRALTPAERLAKDLGVERTTDDQPQENINDLIVRLRGDESVVPEETSEGVWTLGELKIDSPLPVGYPRPTPPKMIEIKEYPSVRRAEVSGAGMRGASNRGFMPLFRHISSNDIAMTAPVEMDLPGWSATDGTRPKEWTMSFLYRTPDMNETGTEGNVVVRDTEPVTVIAIGTQGRYVMSVFNGALKEIETWLAEQDEWEAAGDPRWFGYCGPMTFPTLQWGEVQIPIRRVETDAPERSETE